MLPLFNFLAGINSFDGMASPPFTGSFDPAPTPAPPFRVGPKLSPGSPLGFLVFGTVLSIGVGFAAGLADSIEVPQSPEEHGTHGLQQLPEYAVYEGL